MAFQTKIRKARFVVTGYSAQQMIQMASSLIDRAIKPRIRAGLDVTDGPAKALSKGYARRKQRIGLQPVRDWTLTGRTLRSMKVLSAGQNKAVIGFTDAETNKRAHINNQRVRQFGVSPNDHGKLAVVIGELDSPVQAQAVA